MATAGTIVARRVLEGVDLGSGRAYDNCLMIQKVLTDVLLKYGQAQRDGDLVRLSRDVEVNIFVNVGDQTLNINRIDSVERMSEILVFTTQRHERYIVSHEDVRAVHIKAPGAKTGY
ncbi:MAG: hypothetical protein MJE77_37105 [Proteobacteria bacterium]|nr:hypothetical protein [Pseudomonadota bacterium]